MASRGPSAKEMFFKTKICSFWQAGRCNRGAACSFAHGFSKQSALPDFYKTRPCPQLLASGTCKNGDNCSYAHSKSELRASVGKPSASPKHEDVQILDNLANQLSDRSKHRYNRALPEQLPDMLNGPSPDIWNAAAEGDRWREPDLANWQMRLPENLRQPQPQEAPAWQQQQRQQHQQQQHLQHRGAGNNQFPPQPLPPEDTPAPFALPEMSPHVTGNHANGMGRQTSASSDVDVSAGMDSMIQYLQAIISDRERGQGPPPSRPANGAGQPGYQGSVSSGSYFNAAAVPEPSAPWTDTQPNLFPDASNRGLNGGDWLARPFEPGLDAPHNPSLSQGSRVLAPPGRHAQGGYPQAQAQSSQLQGFHFQGQQQQGSLPQVNQSSFSFDFLNDTGPHQEPWQCSDDSQFSESSMRRGTPLDMMFSQPPAPGPIGRPDWSSVPPPTDFGADSRPCLQPGAPGAGFLSKPPQNGIRPHSLPDPGFGNGTGLGITVRNTFLEVESGQAPLDACGVRTAPELPRFYPFDADADPEFEQARLL